MMESKYIEEQRYVKAKKRVKDIKKFYAHFTIYIIVNIFISGVIVFGLLESNEVKNIFDALSHSGVYMTWIGWGIGVFFHWLRVFGFANIISKNWEERKIQELIEKEKEKRKNI